jgi:hypothetical protein
MVRRTGSADLPLHGGRVPAWLAMRMTELGGVIAEAIVHHYGRDELLRRLAHPFWFQSFGAVMGMDWHSSGITTSVLGALKRALAPRERELGIRVCGGRGRQSRRTPAELVDVGMRVGLDGDALAQTSRLIAKVDSAAVQDGFDLYLHAFVVADDGAWTVVQQALDPARGQARRYHWLSEGLESFVDQPHTAIEGQPRGDNVNLTDRRAARARACQVELVAAGPERTLAALTALRASGPAALALPVSAPTASAPPLATPADVLPRLTMPHHHDVRPSDVLLRRLRGTLAAAADRGPRDFADLLLVPGIGARTVAALAMVAEVVHGAPSRFSDPARFSLAHGGKDGHPFPVPLTVYDETIVVLKTALRRAKLGNDERLAAIRRLDAQARLLERTAGGPSFDDHVAAERRRSPQFGGASVTMPPRSVPAPPRLRSGAAPSQRQSKKGSVRTATARRVEAPGQLRLL